jgi:hypothetical protein
MHTRRILLIAFLTAIGAQDLAFAQSCGKQVVFDISPFFPDAVARELIGVTTTQGEIVSATVDAVFVSNEKAEWSMFANFALPTGIIGVDSITGKWSGTGKFHMSVTSDALNGVLVAPAGTQFVTWYVMWAGGTQVELPGGGVAMVPMDGYFEQLKLTLTLADCPLGDLTNDYRIDVDDLVSLLGQWGSCVECDADLNGDGNVNVDDLVSLLGAWGNYWCPPPFC